jgi:hypothetical protein
LQALVPGIVFDPDNGVLAELPMSAVPPHAIGANRGSNPGSLEELAPVLAQRLSIEASVAQVRGDENEQTAVDRSGLRQTVRGADYSSKTLKRAWNLYPGTTSTTNSEEDDENTYYASRGASVCSVLLSAMVQIDHRIPEAPQYEFEVSKVPTNAQMKRKVPASSYGNAIVIRRGPFNCNASLKVYLSPQKTSGETKSHDDTTAEPSSDAHNQSALDSQRGEKTEDDVDSKEGKNGTDAESKENESGGETGTENVKVRGKSPAENKDKLGPLTVLTAVGVGGTKRESKHNASAKLLAQLFPECKTMIEVKAAAEAAREAYAASKAHRSSTSVSSRRRGNRQEGKSKNPRLSLNSGISYLNATATDKDPPLPLAFSKELLALISQDAKKLYGFVSHVDSFEKLNLNQDSDNLDVVAASSLNTGGDAREESSVGPQSHNSNETQEAMCRQHSRRTQLEREVEKALLVCNEEEERELTVEVGRTVLRRAEPDSDLDRVRKLLSCHDARRKPYGNICPASMIGDALVEDGNNSDGKHRRPGAADEQDDEAMRLWGSCTIVLLLCRSIAAFEDPPLGCAVLTLGFSMQKGRVLRIAQMGSEPHLPRERFLDCLDAFATCMQCTLEREEPQPGPGNCVGQ